MYLIMYIKKGVRVLGIAESFIKGETKSILVGIVMRRDLIIDGVIIDYVTLGGLDSTDTIIRMFNTLSRNDINYIMLSGSVISWFNVIDLNRLYYEINIPVISVSYEETEGLLKYFKEYFPRDWLYRYVIHLRNGSRRSLRLSNGMRIFYRSIGVSRVEAEEVIDRFTLEGKYPEPIRVARLIARAILKSYKKYIKF